MTTPGSRLRVLVVIASYGRKNIGFLRRIIETYQTMTMHVDVVVTSEAEKDLPSGVTIAVGLPSSDPWSLPFAHKQIFAEHRDRYDLFVYSEDDIDVTEAHLRAFVRATELLESDEIAGFLRYEKDPAGAVWMPDVHSMFHWRPESVVRRGEQVFAEFTNEHAAFYVMSAAQLKHSIDSGGFLRAPYKARFDMACTAATDPYQHCGLRKMICVSPLDEFLVHHMSDRYAGQMGLPLSAFEQQLATLRAIERHEHPATTLCFIETQLPQAEWSKSFYEKPDPVLLAMLPSDAATVLSIGCGWGETEAELQRRGAAVTALPLDSVIGAAAARRGMTPVYGRLDECLTDLAGQTFDCVFISNLLHLQPDPVAVFARCVALLRDGGTIVVDTPNFDRLPVLAKRRFSDGEWRKLRSFAESGVSAFGVKLLVQSAKAAGLTDTEVRWYDHLPPKVMGLRSLPWRLGKVTAGSCVLRASRRLAH